MEKKLNNLLTFKDFTGNLPVNNQKKTKRTDVGLDILNEHFFDKLASKVQSEKPLDGSMKELENRITKAAKSGQITKLKVNGDVYSFTILDRNFKLDCSNNCEMTISTPRMIKSVVKGEDEEGKVIKSKEKYSVKFKIDKSTSDNIVKELKKI